MRAVLVLLSSLPHSALAEHAWGGDLSVGLLGSPDSPYTERLDQFGYDADVELHPRWAVNARGRLAGPFWLIASAGRLGAGDRSRTTDVVTNRFGWNSHALFVGPRLEGELGEGGWLIPFVEAGLGVVHATTRMARNGETVASDGFTSHAALFSLGIGTLGERRRFGELGFIARMGWFWAPALENNLGEIHDVGGRSFELGLNWGF